ncbi:MAG: hypothetical protein AABW54_03215 [Candidatus Micrarchaeota archaeon]
MYLFGDQLVWTLVFFGAGIWAAMKYLGGKVGAVGIAVGALLLAMFATDLPLLLAQDVIVGLAVFALVVIAMQYLYRVSFAQGAGIVAIAWVVGTVLLRGVF